MRASGHSECWAPLAYQGPCDKRQLRVSAMSTVEKKARYDSHTHPYTSACRRKKRCGGFRIELRSEYPVGSKKSFSICSHASDELCACANLTVDCSLATDLLQQLHVIILGAKFFAWLMAQHISPGWRNICR